MLIDLWRDKDMIVGEIRPFGIRVRRRDRQAFVIANPTYQLFQANGEAVGEESAATDSEVVDANGVLWHHITGLISADIAPGEYYVEITYSIADTVRKARLAFAIRP